MFMLKCEMLKLCSLFPMHMSNVELKLPDDDARGGGYDWVWPET